MLSSFLLTSQYKQRLMGETSIQYIIAPIVSAILAGIAWAVKHYIAERDADKAEMKHDISELKGEIEKIKKERNEVMSLIAGCDNPDCPNHERLAELMTKKK